MRAVKPYEGALDYLLFKIGEERETVTECVLKGNIDHDEYKRLTGVLQGLNSSVALITDLFNRLERGADEEGNA